MNWLLWSFVAVGLFGVVGLLQKLGTDRISAHSLLVWVTVGYAIVAVPYLAGSAIPGLQWKDAGTGLLIGVVNGLGTWLLFAALERGAKASVAIPLTALYPLVTAILAVMVLGESLTPRQWTGLALAVAAGVLLSIETPDR
jgi:transporter family protein